MSIQMPDYLADQKISVRPPVEILREVAEQLGKQTDGRVEGTVFTLNPGGGTYFRYTFYLLIPSLDDYTDPLFYAWHDLRLYPVTVLRAGGKQGSDDVVCADEVKLRDELERVFQSPDTRERIRVMLALSTR